MDDSLNDEWDSFVNDEVYYINNHNENNDIPIDPDIPVELAPEPSELYISTRTNIIYLCKLVDGVNEDFIINLEDIFWKINITPYDTEANCIIKKQIQLTSTTRERLAGIIEKYDKTQYIKEYIIKHIDNDEGRIKYKDVRKITVGISKKDIICKSRKEKAAFYNCIVNIVRLKINGAYKEFHVKIFNTGKIEIPGIHTDESRNTLMNFILSTLQPFHTDTLIFKKKIETVLINSNFICGFVINRENLLPILENKYNIHSIFDSCSYPGIKCKFYYNKQTGIVDNKQQVYEHSDPNINPVSFMIFRTGSVIIVGNCDLHVINTIYNFVKNLLKTEYIHIKTNNKVVVKPKIKTTRKKIIKIQTTNDIISSNNEHEHDPEHELEHEPNHEHETEYINEK
jgi:TATA-box binding protein (TBP) (component of TFIID and TFIIIB)